MIRSFDFCKRHFRLRYVDKQEPTNDNVQRVIGVTSHDALCIALTSADVPRMAELYNPQLNHDRSPVYYYLKNLAKSRVASTDPSMKSTTSIKNWASHFALYFYELMQETGSDLKKVEYYFKPLMAERKLIDEEMGMVGIPDIVLRLPSKGEDVVLVVDYKTGHIPIDVLRGKQKISSTISGELHYYGWLVHKELNVPLEKMRLAVLYVGYHNTRQKHFHKSYIVWKKWRQGSFNAMIKRRDIVEEALKKNDFDYAPSYDKWKCRGLRSGISCDWCKTCYDEFEKNTFYDLYERFKLR